METREKTCPECGSCLNVVPNYVTWCEDCNWNIHPQWVSVNSLSLIGRINHRLGLRSSENLFNEMADSAEISHPFTWGTFAAYTFSILLHLSSFALVYFALQFTFLPLNLLQFYAGAVLLLPVCIILFWPKKKRRLGLRLERTDYPAIYQLLDEMAERLHAPKVVSIHAEYDFNAYATRIGWRQKPTVGIGLPLFSVLDLYEKIAILGHEMGHLAHRDITRKWVIRKAINTLTAWYRFLYPVYDNTELIGPFDLILRFVRRRLADLVYSVYFLLGISIWKQSQRAEYFADLAAAQLAGTDVAVSALGKSHFSPTFHMTLEKVAQHRYTSELFSELRKFMQQVPEKEQRRILRINESASVQLDSTHPPTKYRVGNLRHHAVAAPSMKLSADFIAQLEEEFRRLEEKTERQLLDDYRAWNY